MDDQLISSPWMTAKQAAEYLGRGRRFVLREIKSGRMRGAIVSGRGGGEIRTRREWCDACIEDRAQPIALSSRRRA